MQPTTLAAALAPDVAPSADELPILRIGPAGRLDALNLRELWRYRELLFFLTWRDVKIRYKQTVLGAAWAVIQPVFSMIVFTLLFGKLAQMPSEGVPYAVFSYVALLPWTYFANALGSASNSLVGNTSLVSKVYFPRLIIPASAVLAGLVDYAVASAVLAVLLPVHGIVPPVTALVAVPLLTLLTSVLALGVGLWLSALNVQYRDIRYVVPFLVQLWMFATPIVYPLSLVPEAYRWLAALNPMTGVIEGYRSALLGRPWDLPALGVSIAAATILLVTGAFYFRRAEDTFADVI